MTTVSNITTTNDGDDNKLSLLWLPHVLIAVGFLSFLGINFWLYHRKNKEKYRRKAEAVEARNRMQERRRVLNIVRMRYMPVEDIEGNRQFIESTNPDNLSLPYIDTECAPYANSESSELSECHEGRVLLDDNRGMPLHVDLDDLNVSG